jgi:hypothetical protein
LHSVLAILSGTLTGLLMRVPIFEQVREKEDMFDDQLNFITPSNLKLFQF